VWGAEGQGMQLQTCSRTSNRRMALAVKLLADDGRLLMDDTLDTTLPLLLCLPKDVAARVEGEGVGRGKATASGWQVQDAFNHQANVRWRVAARFAPRRHAAARIPLPHGRSTHPPPDRDDSGGSTPRWLK
jgi:hypothetical protein